MSAAVIVSGLALVPASPATASTYTYARPATWAYTDSSTPDTPYVNPEPDAPVGAWRDPAGDRHVSRSYFAYDLRPFLGNRIISATFVARETEVNDCNPPRAWELWSTDPITPATSWSNPPRELVKVAEIGGRACPGLYIEADLTDAVQDAVAQGRSTLTLELRVRGRQEVNVHFGRRIRHDPGISIHANAVPGTPTQLRLDYQTCAGPEPQFITTTTPALSALLTDPEGSDTAYATFAIWPVDRPQDRIELPESWAGYTPTWAWAWVPAGLLANGGSYAFAVRSRDDYDFSAWSPECRFTVDTQRPDRPPVVTSTDYPDDGSYHGGPGIPGDFTFSADGVSDVVGFRYGAADAPTRFVAADTMGGSVTVQFTPTYPGPTTLYVASVDRAGNSSDQVRYSFRVRDTAPSIEDANPDAWLGDPHTLIFRPNMPDTVTYTYQIDDGPEQTIAAGPDGSAQVAVVPAAQGTMVSVYSTTAGGLRSGVNSIYLWVSTAPVIESADFPLDGRPGMPVGSPGSFTLKPHMHGVVEYVYQFNRYQEDEQPPQAVPAGPDGSATVEFTATRAGYNTLLVFSRTADGYVSDETEVAFYPASIAPRVSSTQYPAGQSGGGPGIEGTFVFQPVAANVVEYTYQFGDEPQQTVPAGSDGTASIRWTPQEYPEAWGGWVTLQVRSRSANGLVSDRAYYGFRVNALEPTVVSDIYQWPNGGRVGQTGRFTFTARLPASVEFVYFFDSEPAQVVSVGADGTATISWTPQTPYTHFLTVRSRTATGLQSGPAFVPIRVYP
ncbi:MAG TPA: hypothetical protein VFM55_06030 [Micromonosporaceae bacterium]|nr:hypothetical protein [Micromonosporaceae bacterium]